MFIRLPLVLFILISALSGVSHASGVGSLSKFDSLINTLVTWLQGIGLVLAIGGLVLAGIRWAMAEHDAFDRVKSAFIGAMVIGGASLIVGFIKGFLI